MMRSWILPLRLFPPCPLTGVNEFPTSKLDIGYSILAIELLLNSKFVIRYSNSMVPILTILLPSSRAIL